MIGTLINFSVIILGSFIGILFGSRISENLKHTVINGMGLFTTAVGVQMFFNTENSLIVLGSLIAGAILGEWWQIEDGLEGLGIWLEKRFSKSSEEGSSKFARGFLTATVLFCTGPMAVLGAISDGLRGDYLTLSIKSMLDGLFSIAFSSTLGIGVAFAAFPVLFYQGGISLLAAQLNSIITTSMMNELTATGGVLLIGIGLSSLLEIKKIRVGNFLPALVIAPLVVFLIKLIPGK